MKQRFTYFLVFILTLFLVACSNEDITGEFQTPPDEFTDGSHKIASFSEAHVKSGFMRVKFKTGSTDKLDSNTRSGETTTRTGISEIDLGLADLNVIRIERTFHHGGKWEPRHIKAGLHLWYDVYFDDSVPVRSAMSKIVNSQSILHIEPAHEVVFYGNEAVFRPMPLPTTTGNQQETRAGTAFFNDPGLSLQWHYDNDGTINNPSYPGFFLKGADINASKAWAIETGKPEVIVAIIDTGVDFNHEDLKQNMWVNQAELNGTAGVDDDGNGYIDDIHGWNFVRNSSVIYAEMHGTHVAGTVAAVNNNNIGVGGVAGGNGSAQSGARVMVCQIIQGNSSSSSIVNTFAYAADNGAVISQNSWGYPYATSIPQSDKEAIDYFIRYAGMDITGDNQIGPMRGGLVVFAAGNDAKSNNLYPAAYAPVISVANMGPNFKRSATSTWGNWIDVTAPGGNDEPVSGLIINEANIFSTVPNNKYMGASGTSMACPHVSGVAALVISKYGVGNKGFSVVRLKRIIQTAVQDIYLYNPTPPTPSYKGRTLGSGYVDAHKALTMTFAENDADRPNPVTNITATNWSYNSATVQWTGSLDKDGSPSYRYDIICGTTDPTTWSSFDTPTGSYAATEFRTAALPVANEKYTLDLTDQFKSGLKQYITITAVDIEGNRSKMASTSGSTLVNLPPEIQGLPDGPIVLAFDEKVITHFTIIENEFKWGYKFIPGGAAASMAKELNGTLRLTIDAKKAQPGNYTATLIVFDEKNATTTAEIEYIINSEEIEIVPVVKPLPNLYFGALNNKQTLNLNEYFTEVQPESYTIDQGGSDFITFTQTELGVYELQSKGYGTGRYKVTASYKSFDPISAEFNITARDNSQEIDLYPVPVIDILNIRMGEDVFGLITVSVVNDYGNQVLTEELHIGPFAPAKLDMTTVKSGKYTIKINWNGKNISRRITKR